MAGGGISSLCRLPRADYHYLRMLILSLDTSTTIMSCAVARDGVLVREEGGDATGQHVARLPGDLMALLARAELTLTGIDAFAVATGPGSFTGLRVGIATMQGLACATGRPLLGVSGFEALARQSAPPPRTDGASRIATWVDAWRGEVFAALYEEGREVEPPVVAHPEAVLVRLAHRRTLFSGSGAASFRGLITEKLGDDACFTEPVTPFLAGAIALLATENARALAFHGEPLPRPDALRPLYVGRAHPELARNASTPRVGVTPL
jgi:tRNA threonylcarbamoyladenosine biosynthesis protein TsaB